MSQIDKQWFLSPDPLLIGETIKIGQMARPCSCKVSTFSEPAGRLHEVLDSTRVELVT